MKFDRQLRPATETSWVVSYGGKTIPRWRTAAILKIDISSYLSEKSSDFHEIVYTAADFELDERHVIKNKNVALDRLRVRQNVFIVVRSSDQSLSNATFSFLITWRSSSSKSAAVCKISSKSDDFSLRYEIYIPSIYMQMSWLQSGLYLPSLFEIPSVALSVKCQHCSANTQKNATERTTHASTTVLWVINQKCNAVQACSQLSHNGGGSFSADFGLF